MHCHECFSYMNCHTDPVGSVMFVERISRHQEALAKDTLKLGSPLDITSWNLSAPGFWDTYQGCHKSP